MSEESKKRNIGVEAFTGTFGASLFIQACTIVQGIIIARFLGPFGRGEYAAIILWPSLFAAIGIFGSNIALARIAAKIEELPALFRSSVVLGLITSIITALFCYIMIPHLMPRDNQHLVTVSQLFVLFIPINHLGLNIIAIDQGFGNFKVFNLTRSLIYPIYIVMIMILWLFKYNNVKSFVIALLVANLLVVILRCILGLKRYPLFGKLYQIKQILKSSIHFGLAGIAQPLYLQADKALMLWLLGAEQLGIYVVALSASAVIGSITGAAGIVSFTTAAQEETGKGFDRIARTFRISALLWLFLGSILGLIMQFVLPLVYGNEFSSAVNPARLLIAGSAFAGLANLLEQSMRGQGRAFVGLEGRVAGLIMMALCGILLSSGFAIAGVCAAYIAGQLTCLLVIIVRTNQHFNVTRYITNYMPNNNDIISLVAIIKRIFVLG